MGLGILMTLFLAMGVAICLIYAAQAGRITFSLKSIFIIVTISCIGLAMIGALGPGPLLTLAFFLLTFLLPSINLIVVATLFTAIANTTGERRAGFIGNVTPLVALGLVNVMQAASGFAHWWHNQGYASLLLFAVLYFTAWLAGRISRFVFSSSFAPPSKHPLTGAYRKGFAMDQSKATHATTPKESAATGQTPAEPDVYEIG